MRSSAFRISFVSGEMCSLMTEKMKSGFALREKESRYRLVTSRISGVTWGSTRRKDSSSSSMTAVSTRWCPAREAFLMSVLSTPAITLPPARLSTWRTPLSVSRSFSRLLVVVLPLVPETKTIRRGFSICARKTGSMRSAITPGICPALRRISLRPAAAALDAARARWKRGPPCPRVPSFTTAFPSAGKQCPWIIRQAPIPPRHLHPFSEGSP